MSHKKLNRRQFLTSTAAAFSLAASSSWKPSRAAELMDLAEIEKGLLANPPHLGEDPIREKYYGALDAWALAPDTIYWDRDPKTSNPHFLAYYLRSMERALSAAAKTRVSSGAAIWKLYSSGFLIKTPSTTFAIDVVEGPYKNINKSPAADPAFLFKWTDAMRARFAAITDLLFITHWHYDHASFALAQAMILEPGRDHTLGPLTVRTFDGVQYMRQDEAGDWISVPKYDAQNNVYLIRTKGGTTFLHHGDNRGKDFAGWLKKAVEDGWTVDIWFIPIYWPKTMIPDVEKLIQPVMVPCHEHELGHKPTHGVITLMSHYRGPLRRHFKERRALRLTWSEAIHFQQATPAVTNATRSHRH